MIEMEYFEYIERLADRRLEVNSSILELGKLGALMHPIKIVKLTKEKKRIEEIDEVITKMTYDLNNLRRGNKKVDHLVLEKRLGRYMEENPISEKGVSLRKKKIRK